MHAHTFLKHMKFAYIELDRHSHKQMPNQNIYKRSWKNEYLTGILVANFNQRSCMQKSVLNSQFNEHV